MKFKKISILVVLLATLSVFGCGGYESMLREIPEAEFEEFSYHRGGNVTSANIVAKGAKIEGEILTIDELNITADYGPFASFNVQLKAYKRKIGKSEK